MMMSSDDDDDDDDDADDVSTGVISLVYEMYHWMSCLLCIYDCSISYLLDSAQLVEISP